MNDPAEAPVQFVLCGFPFSGKSTLAKLLERERGWACVSIDAIKEEFGYGEMSDDDVPDVVWSQLFDEADRRLVMHLRDGRSVVNETAWTTRQWRDRARKVATDAGFSTKVIYLDVPEEVARRRRLQNRTEATRYDTPDSVFEEAIRDFEIPTVDEDVLIYDGTPPLKLTPLTR